MSRPKDSGGTSSASQSLPTDPRSRWSVDFLKAINAPVTLEAIKLVNAWQQGEGTKAGYNPLATTQEQTGATWFNTFGGGKYHVKNYSSREGGLRATAQTIQNGHYNGLLAALRAGVTNAAATVQQWGKELDTWGTGGSHVYGILSSGRGTYGGHTSGDAGNLGLPTDQFPLTQALVNAHPDLLNVYNQWLQAGGPNSGWTGDRLQSMIEATPWWASMTPTQRAAAQASITAGSNTAFQAGLGGDKIGDAAQLKQYASQMGVHMSDGWFRGEASNIAIGSGSLQASMDAIKKLAISTFPTIADQINGGQTVQDIASPYMNAMSQILELPAGQITLRDPTIRRALTSVDPKTNAPTLQPIWGFETQLKQDPRWLKTNNSRDDLFNTLQKVGSDMGFLGG